MKQKEYKMENLDDYEYNIETDYKGVRHFSILRWTTEPPTVEGWYWALDVYQKGINKIVYVTQGTVFEVGNLIPQKIGNYHHWLGPLPIPEPPKD